MAAISILLAVTAQQHRICFVIGLLVCTSTLRRPLPRICGTAEQLRFLVYEPFRP
jgi:hypothetical protein